MLFELKNKNLFRIAWNAEKSCFCILVELSEDHDGGSVMSFDRPPRSPKRCCLKSGAYNVSILILKKGMMRVEWTDHILQQNVEPAISRKNNCPIFSAKEHPSVPPAWCRVLVSSASLDGQYMTSRKIVSLSFGHFNIGDNTFTRHHTG